MYHIWAWQPSWSCDLDRLNKLSFPHLMESPYERRTCIKNTQIMLKNQHAATARLFLRKVSGIVVVLYESGINLTC